MLNDGAVVSGHPRTKGGKVKDAKVSMLLKAKMAVLVG